MISPEARMRFLGIQPPEDMPQTCLPSASSKAAKQHSWFHRDCLLSSRERNLLPLHIHVKVALCSPVDFFFQALR